MAEELIISEGAKAAKYATLYRQVEAVVEAERDAIARMANIAAMLHQTFGFWWTGFYRVVGDELVLGPFQGPMACTRIGYGRGVCGTAWLEGRSIVVDDVDKFPGHIACSSLSRSEIVVPIFRSGLDPNGPNPNSPDASTPASDTSNRVVTDRNSAIVGVLDIDSRHLATFDTTDREWLERIAKLIY